MKKLKVAIVAAVLGLSLYGCSKSEESSSSSGPSILDTEIVSYLPASSLGFFTWNTDTPSYKKLKASVWGNNMSKSLEMVKNLEANEDTKKIVPIIDSLVQTGFLPKNAQQPDVIHSGVAFVDIDKAAKLPNIAIYMAAAAGQDLKTKVPTLETTINAQGYKTTKETIAGAEGFSVPVGSPGSPFQKVLVAYSANKLAISSSPDLVGRLFNGKPEGGIQQIKSSNEFKQATRGVTSPEESMSYAFFDMNKFISTVSALGLNPEQDPSAELKDIPVESFALSSSMKDNLSYTVAVSLNPKTETQKKVITALNGAAGGEVFSKVPADLMLLLTLDGKTIASIKNAALTEVPVEALGPMGEQLKLLDSLKSISIGIRGASGPTPFPEVVLMAETGAAAETEKLLQGQLDGLLAGSGMPMPWQQKEIGGVQVRYALTPFGVGAYVANGGDKVLVASAEKLMADVLSSGKSSSPTLMAGVSESSKKMLSSSKPMVIAYTDFNKIANALGSAQDSLAMFTGGKGGITREQLEQMRQVGTVLLALNLEDNLVKLHSAYELPPAPQG